jgi:hypothetical protein
MTDNVRVSKQQGIVTWTNSEAGTLRASKQQGVVIMATSFYLSTDYARVSKQQGVVVMATSYYNPVAAGTGGGYGRQYPNVGSRKFPSLESRKYPL